MKSFSRLARAAAPGAALGMLAAGLLAACAGTSQIGYTYVSDNYSMNYLRYAAGRGGMLTEVVGNPFAADKAALDRRVTESFETAHFGPELPFFTEPPADYSSSYKVVVLFDAAPSANAARLCGDAERPQRTAGDGSGTVYVLAAFCSADTRVTSAGGSVAASGPDDPGFRSFMNQLSLQLFPPQAPDRNDRDSDFFSKRPFFGAGAG